MRRIGVHEIICGEERLQQGVIELDGEQVKAFYPLREELPMTEWWGGSIELKRQPDGRWQAYRNGVFINETFNPKSK